MKIWLDDIRDAPEGFVHVHNLKELEKLLQENNEEIELMSFDHDLGLGEPTGYDIAKWLGKNHLDRWPKKIEVHSQNPVGADNIDAYDDFVHRRLI